MNRELEDIVFYVREMSCSSCEIKIENVLRKIDGVIKVKASLAESQVTVKYDSSVLGIEKLKMAIKKLGYEEGNITYTCWMGMLNGYIKVVDDINKIALKAIKKEIEAYRPAGGGGCCGR